MAEAKTKPTEVSVSAFLETATPQRAAEARVLIEMMTRLSGEPAVMWGPSIIGFGRRSYSYPTGRSGVTPAVGFSPRKPALVLYIDGAADECERLGKVSRGVSCVYVKRLTDIEFRVLEEMVGDSLATPPRL